MPRSAKIPTRLTTSLTAAAVLSVGVGTFAYLVFHPPELNPKEGKGSPRLVRVLEARKGPHRMAITAYGTSRASREWAAIAEVHGRAVEVNERFEPGEILPAGTLLVRIDPTDYQLAVERLEAEVASQQLQGEELDRNEQNLREIEKLQRRQLQLAEEERDRLQELYERNKAASESALDAAQGAVVTRMTALRETENKLALIPVQRDLLQASLKVLRVQLRQGRRELEKCQVRLSFDARCTAKSVEVDQFVAVGERLGNFLALEQAEVVAMVETRKMRALFPRGIPELGTLDLTRMDLGESVFDRVEVPAEVRWGPWGEPQVWRGRVARLASGLDEQTRTLPVVVEVPDPYSNVTPGVRPPLVPDVFCQVTLFGATVDDVVVIPRDALHRLRRDVLGDGDAKGEEAEQYVDVVYVLQGGRRRTVAGGGRQREEVVGGKLHRQQVTVLAEEEDLVVIEQGIDEGDLVILTDLFPAGEGMPLDGLLGRRIAETPAAGKRAGEPGADRRSSSRATAEEAP